MAVDFWRTIEAGNPRYHSKYRDLILLFAAKGGATDAEKHLRAKTFSTVYEFYIYAAVIGLYRGTRLPLSDEKGKYETFWEIRNWTKRGADEVVKFVFMSLIAESEIDLIELEEIDSDDDVKERIQQLVRLLEEYANAGFQYIQSRYNEDPQYFESERCFVNLIGSLSNG